MQQQINPLQHDLQVDGCDDQGPIPDHGIDARHREQFQLVAAGGDGGAAEIDWGPAARFCGVRDEGIR